MKRKLLLMLMAFLLLFALMSSMALAAVWSYEKSGSCGDDVSWDFSDDGTLTISGSGEMANYDSVSSTPWCLLRDKIKGVEISEGVTSIGDNSFNWCTELTSVEIANSVTSIGKQAFENCSSIVSIDLPNSIKSIDDYAFYGCSSLSSVNMSKRVTNIGSYVFSDCESLNLIEIPSSVKSIGKNAFSPYKIKKVYIDDLAAWCAISFGNGLANPLYSFDSKYNLEDNGAQLYLNNKRITEIVIPDGTKSISDYAFTNFTSMTSVTIPRSIKNIGLQAFANCSGLKEVHYEGSRTDWYDINIGSVNDPLRNAYFASAPEPDIENDDKPNIDNRTTENSQSNTDSNNSTNGTNTASSSVVTINTKQVIINGKTTIFNSSTGISFVDKSYRTLVPLRATMEAFGCNVEWDPANNTATLTKNNTTVTMLQKMVVKLALIAKL